MELTDFEKSLIEAYRAMPDLFKANLLRVMNALICASNTQYKMEHPNEFAAEKDRLCEMYKEDI